MKPSRRSRSRAVVLAALLAVPLAGSAEANAAPPSTLSDAPVDAAWYKAAAAGAGIAGVASVAFVAGGAAGAIGTYFACPAINCPRGRTRAEVDPMFIAGGAALGAFSVGSFVAWTSGGLVAVLVE